MKKLKQLWEWIMSLYIGNNGTQKVAHIYNGSTGIEKNPFSGTSFHSSLPYLKIKSRHVFTYNGTTPYSLNQTYNAYNSKGYVTTTPIENINNGFCFVIGYIGSKRVFFPYSAGTGEAISTMSIPGSFFGNPCSSEPAFCLTSATTGYTGTITFRKDLLPLYTELIYDHIDVIILDTAVHTPATDIIISNSELSINGNPVFDTTYLHFCATLENRTNTIDEVIAIPYGAYYFTVVSNGILKPNYVTENGGVYTNNVSGGAYTLVQLINSNPMVAPTSISIDKNSISATKNGINTPYFNAATNFKANVVKYPEFLVVGSGFRIDASGVYHLLDYSIDISDGDILHSSIRTPSYTWQYIAQMSASCVVSNGGIFYFYAGGCYMHLYGVMNTASGTISFYCNAQEYQLEYNPQYYRTFITDFLLTIIIAK